MTSTAHPQSTGRTAPEPAAEPPRRRSRWALARRIISPLISIAIIVAVFAYFLPKFTSVSAIWASVRGMSWWQVGVLALAALWNLASYWLVMVATMPGLTYPQAAVVTQSGTAVSNTLPGGGAIGIGLSYAMYSSWGFSRSRSSVSLLVSGVWNNFAKLGMPVLALALIAVQGSPGAGRLVAALAGFAALVGCLVLFAMILRSEATARRIGLGAGRVASGLVRLFGRPPVSGWELATVKFCCCAPGGSGSP
jgi:uncharacterized membrane protein YbhN (UPF0104 family)